MATGCPATHPLSCQNHCYKEPTNWNKKDLDAWVAGGKKGDRPARCPYSEWRLQLASKALTQTEKDVGWESGGNTDVWGPSGAPLHILFNRVKPKLVQQVPDSVFVGAEWYGNKCMGGNSMPKDPVTNYALMLSNGAGCAIKEDPMSKIADKQTTTAFIKDNGDLLPNALTLPNFLEKQIDKNKYFVNLLNR